MKTSLWWGLALVALGCAPVQVTTQVEPGVDFSRYRSFAQAPPREASDPAVRARIEREIDAVMQTRGLVPAPLESADLVVASRSTGKDRERLTDIGFPGSAQYVIESYVEGTLVIDVFARGGDRLWHGVGRVDVAEGGDLGDAAARAVRAVLADFPAEPAGGSDDGP